ncbi:MAG: hypothetical protein ACK5ME_10960 [Parahaliea sp.]
MRINHIKWPQNPRPGKRYSESGSASVELIIGCLAAIPLFFGISLLGKYADMRHKTVEAARYVAWEEVIWEGDKSQEDYRLEATDRLLGYRSGSIVDRNVLVQDGVSEDPLWRDHSTRTLMVSDGSTIRVNVAEQRNIGPAHNGPVQRVARNAGLEVGTITRYDVSLPFTNRLRIPKPDEKTNLFNFFDPDHYLAHEVLNFQASSAILSDAWQADDINEYKQRIRNLTVEDKLGAAVALGTKTFGAFVLFKEGRDGDDPDIVAEPEALLEEYKP